MSRSAWTAALAATLLAACHHTPPAPAVPATGTPENPSAPRTTRPDSATAVETALVGDWQWSGDLNQAAANGTWSMSRANGRWTGVLIMGSYPAAPLQGMSVQGQDFEFTASVVNADYRFRCHLETPQTATCFVSGLSTTGRVTAYRR